MIILSLKKLNKLGMIILSFLNPMRFQISSFWKHNGLRTFPEADEQTFPRGEEGGEGERREERGESSNGLESHFGLMFGLVKLIFN